jgi:hypothetical protein
VLDILLNSSIECISSKTSSPRLLASELKFFISSLSRIDAINSIASAPIDFDSTIWYSLIINSFLSIGISILFLTLLISDILPSKYFSFVNIETPTALALSYPFITSEILDI